MTKRGGFTLVELVVVIVAVGVLATLGVLAFNRYQDVQRQKVETAASKETPRQTPQQNTPQTIDIPATANQPTGQVMNTDTEAPKLPVPTDVTVVANSATSVTVNWSTVPSARSYVVRYSLGGNNQVFTEKASKNSAVITKNITQGTQWSFTVRAVIGGVEGSDSATANITTPINAPAAYTLTNSSNPASLTAIASSAVCPEGTKAYYLWKANNTQWVQGFEYDTVTYSLSPGQGVSLQSFVRCHKDEVVSEFAPSTNSVTQKRASSLRSISYVN